MSAVTELAPGQVSAEAQVGRAGGNTLTRDRVVRDAQTPGVPGNPLADDHRHRDTRSQRVVSNPLAGDQKRSESHRCAVPGIPLVSGQSIAEAQSGRAADNPLPAAIHAATPNRRAPREHLDADLMLAAATLDDIERVRMSTGLRIGAMEREGAPASDAMLAVHQALKAVEHDATLHLQRTMRKHPLGPWVKRTTGIGEKQGARLIAAIGDPYIKDEQTDENGNVTPARPRRGPAELWAYCGYAPEQKRRKGVKSNWNAQAKMRAFLIAESCMKCRASPYRTDYDRARLSWANRDVSDGHKHNHALRVVAKAVLRDLYLEAKRLGGTA